MANLEFASENWWERHKVNLPAGQNGRWAVEQFTVGPATRLQPYFAIYGRDCPPGSYTRLVRYDDGAPEIGETMDASVPAGGHPVMTDTPGEIADHREVMREIERRGGRVLIHGLGLGVIIRFALAYEHVTHIDVVELDEDVIGLVARHYKDERLLVHHGDACTYRWPAGMRWSVVWHDIWDNHLDANLTQMAVLHRCFAGRADWQGSWSRDYLLTQRQRRQRSAR